MANDKKAERAKFFVNPILLVTILAVLVGVGMSAGSYLYSRSHVPQFNSLCDDSSSTVTTEPTEEPTKGCLSAPVTMIEFAEFYCPYCARYLWLTFPRIEEEYIKKGLVKYVFRNLVVHGSPALLASAAGECAQEQGKFWKFHDHLFYVIFQEESGQYLNEDELKRVAKEVGLDMNAFNQCFDSYNDDFTQCSESYNRCVEDTEDDDWCSEDFNRCLFSNRVVENILGADRGELDRLIEQLSEDEKKEVERIGTPTFFINGRLVIGAEKYEVFKQIIEEELEKAQKTENE